MDCPDPSTLQEFVAGLLPPERAETVERHMDACASCRKAVSAAAKGLCEGDSKDPPLDAVHSPGQRVDHFEILDLLGAGGMGRVYLARDTRLGREVALKILRAGSKTARLMQEARTTARFNHPNIVTIHQVGELSGRPYLALEHLQGQTLQQRASAQPLRVDEVLQVGLAMARALAEAHAHGVLHRDLKPSNVMIVGDELSRAKVLDFGLAQSVELDTGADQEALHGTPAYMAPEQFTADAPATPAADVWALGVILYELLDHRRPFEGKRLAEQIQLVTAPGRAPELEAEVPEGLALLVGRCLDKEPSGRPAAAQVVARLEAIQASLGLARQRRRRLAVLVIALALLAAGATVVALVVAGQRREAQRQRLVAEAGRVEAQLEGALRAVRSGDNLEARARLRDVLEHRDALRARALWWRLTRDPLRWRRRMPQTVNGVAHAPDGGLLAVAAGPAVQLLEPQTGRTRRVLGGPRDQLMGLAFSPDGRTLAGGSWGGEIWRWELTTGKGSRAPAGAAIYAVSFSPDGRLLAAGCRDGVRTWRAGSVRRLPGGAAALDVRFSPDGRVLAAAGKDGRVHLWELPGGTPRTPLVGHTASVMGLAFAPDGRLASGGRDRTVRSWRLAGGQLQRTLEVSAEVTRVAFGPRDLLAASAGDGRVHLWSSSGHRALRGHAGTVWELSFSPDGRTLVTGGVDRFVRAWRPAALRAERRVDGHRGAVLDVGFSPDGTRLASGGRDGEVRIWDAASGALVRVLAGHAGAVRAVAFSPDGRSLASAGDDRSLRLWDLATGRLARLLLGHGAAVRGACFSPDGRLLASGSADGTARLWEVASGRQLRVLSGHEGGVQSPRFSADGRLLVTAGYDGTARTWQVADGRPLATLRGHGSTVYGAAFAGGGVVVTTSSDGTVRRWSGATGTILGRHPGRGYDLDVDLAGGQIGVATSDGAARIWRGTGEPLALRGHRGEVRAVALGPDGRLAATAGSDGTVRLWDTRTGAPRWRPPPSPQQRGEARLGRLTLEERPACPLQRLARGPARVVAAGFACGVVGIWSPNGELLHRARLHGPVTGLWWRGAHLHAVSELGAASVWDLEALKLERCALLRRVWRDVPVIWAGGRAVLRPPPDDHPCREGRP